MEGHMQKGTWIGALVGIIAATGVAHSQQSYEIWNYYAAGSELAGMNALVELANKEHPDVKFVSRVIPGNVVEMRRQLETTFLGGKPPAAYQSSMASELATFVNGGRLHPLTDVWSKINGDKIFPEGVQRVAKVAGVPYGVPYDFSLINNVFYNKGIFAKLKLTPPTDWDSFTKTCDALRAANIEPLGNAGGPFWSLYNFYAPLVSTVGNDGYYKIASGELAFDSPEFRKALDLYRNTMVKCYAKNWSGKTWTQTADDVVNGATGMDMMGIWAAGYMEKAGLKPVEQFDSFPAPGTIGKAIFQMDLFAVPEGTKDATAAADEFLQSAASVKGQQTFALNKGSLAPNVEVDPSVYGPEFAIFANELRTASKANAVLPNLFFLLPTNIGTELGNQIEKFAIDPSDATEDDVIKTLEPLRQQALADKAYTKW
jgi:ABC-type glycerol-3-phosphate transport system substrate-binding protein